MNSFVVIVGHALIALALALSFFIIRRFVKWYFTPLHNLPGPKGNNSFWFGSFQQVRKEPFMEPHKRWWTDAGLSVQMIHYTSILGRSSVLILDKEIAKTILTAPPATNGMRDRFHKQIQFLKGTIGDGLVTLEGENWTRHRRILQPSFHTSFVKKTLNAVVPQKMSKFIECWIRAAEQSREIDAASHLSALTLDIIGTAGFSHEFNGLRVVEDWSLATTDTTRNKESDQLAEIDDPFISAILDSLKPNLVSILFLILGVGQLDAVFNPKSRRMRRMLNEAADQVIVNAKTKARNNGPSGESSQSLLHLMLEAQDPNAVTKGRTLNNVELRDESKLFIVAGHETTSTWLYWAMYVLANHPDVQDKVHKNILKHAPLSVTDIDVEAVEKMEYLNAFMQEVLRLYPPVGFVVRGNTNRERFGGQDIPPGTRLVIPVHLLHRHPLYWDNPESFLPERWMNATEKDVERRRFAFLPFSAGVRNCIGYRFATIEALLIVAPLIRAFSIAIAPSQKDVDFTFSAFITTKSKPLLKIVVKKR